VLASNPQLSEELMTIDATGSTETLEAQIERLSAELIDAKAAVQAWANTNTDLSRNAAEMRAKNQSTGRNFMGALLGAKYRHALRMGATASNAAIARDVANKRLQIVAGKREAQELVKRLQQELSEAKQALKKRASGDNHPTGRDSFAKTSIDSLALIGKLKDAYTAGLLTDSEYEEKRKALLARIG
jgi:prefoldin subunit 5